LRSHLSFSAFRISAFPLCGELPTTRTGSGSNLRFDALPEALLSAGARGLPPALHAATPRLLTNGHKTPKEEMRELLDQVKPEALRERLVKAWAKL
jgi:hypothetical protein